MTWLASDAAREWTAQIVRSFTTDHLWTFGDLDSVMPRLLDAKRRHDERAKREGEPEKT